MKLQATIDKLFSHKMFSNKYFLYAVVAASILTNYMRIVAGHYEVVGFFILVGVIMMNFSKNVAVVLTVCLLLTQIIMAGKAVREGLENPVKNALTQIMTPEQLTSFKKYNADLSDINKKLAEDELKLSNAQGNVVEANAALNAANASIAKNNASIQRATDDINTAKTQMEKKIAKQLLAAANEALTKSNADLASAQKKLDNNKNKIPIFEANIAKYKIDQQNLQKLINDLIAQVKADNASKASNSSKPPDTPANKLTNKPNKLADKFEKAMDKAMDKAAAKAANNPASAAPVTPASTVAASIVNPGNNVKKNKFLNKIQNAQKSKKALDVLKKSQLKAQEAKVTAAAKVAAAKARKRVNINRNNFALLNENDDDADDGNEFDFMGPNDISGLTQGTTNLMTKQKDLFSFMNSMTPLIENAKKMLSGLDLSKLRA